MKSSRNFHRAEKAFASYIRIFKIMKTLQKKEDCLFKATDKNLK